jgi:hypothetical protein
VLIALVVVVNALASVLRSYAMRTYG